jgi:hypothetical protein
VITCYPLLSSSAENVRRRRKEEALVYWGSENVNIILSFSSYLELNCVNFYNLLLCSLVEN